RLAAKRSVCYARASGEILRMVRFLVVIAVTLLALRVAWTQEPSPAEELLRPPTVATDEPAGRLMARPRWYAVAGILVAPPILFDNVLGGGASVLPPIPAPWATVGYRRANDVSWQASFLLVPLYQPGDRLFFSTVGLDFDRISTDHSPWPGFDLRWQVGL